MSELPGGNRETWGTRVGVILAVTGSAVGLGNFLRFPGQAAQYGGGAFMIPYAVAFLLLGLPIAWTEWSLGRYGGARGYNSAPGVFRAVWQSGAAPYLGVLGPVIPVMIYMYYVFIEAWCLGYAWYYLTGDLALGAEPEAYDDFFAAFVGAGENGFLLSEGGSVILFLLVCFVLNFVLIYRGLNKGIEWFCKWAMPALVIIALVILARVLTLGTPDPSRPDQSLLNGVGYMWNPVHEAEDLAPSDAAVVGLLDAAGASAEPAERANGFDTLTIHDGEAFGAALGEAGWTPADGERGERVYEHAESRLTLRVGPQTAAIAAPGFWRMLSDPEIWLAAAGQIFFSLSIGFGIVITYSSYMKPDDDVALSSTTAAAGNGFCELALGGLIVIPAAFVFLGMGTVTNPPGTFGMGFVALPNVFNQMPAGWVFGFLFFFLLFLAAVTSSLSMLQPAIALLEEGLGLGRKASVALLGFITAVGTGFIVFFSKGFLALDTIDFWVGTMCIYVMATIQIILFAWVLGIDRGMAELTRGAEIRVPRFVRYMIQYVAPIYLLVIFAMWLVRNAPERVRSIGQWEAGEVPVVALSVGLIALVFVFFLLLIGRASERWKRAERSRSEEEVTP